MSTEEEKRRHRCCFAGPRIEGLGIGEQELRPWLESKITGSIEAGYTTFITGLAMGCDILAGEIVIRLRETMPQVKLIAISPYPGFEQKWKPEQRSRYRELIRDADLLKYADGRYSEDAVRKRNAFMLRHSARVIAVEAKGSTSVCEMLADARAQGLEICLCAEDDLERIRSAYLKQLEWPRNLYHMIDAERSMPGDGNARIACVLACVDEGQRGIMLSRFRDGKTIGEIAATLGMENESVNGAIEKTLKKLRFHARADFLFGSDAADTPIQKELVRLLQDERR